MDKVAKLRRGSPTAIGAPAGGILVSEADLLFAYRGLLVLRIMCKKEKLTGAIEATDEIIAKLGEVAPHLPGLASLRATAPEGTGGKP